MTRGTPWLLERRISKTLLSSACVKLTRAPDRQNVGLLALAHVYRLFSGGKLECNNLTFYRSRGQANWINCHHSTRRCFQPLQRKPGTVTMGTADCIIAHDSMKCWRVCRAHSLHEALLVKTFHYRSARCFPSFSRLLHWADDRPHADRGAGADDLSHSPAKMIRNHIRKSHDPKRRASLCLSSDPNPLLTEGVRRRGSLFTPTGPLLTVPPVSDQRRSSFPGVGTGLPVTTNGDITRRRSSSVTPDKTGGFTDIDGLPNCRSLKIVVSTIGLFLVAVLVYSFVRLVTWEATLSRTKMF